MTDAGLTIVPGRLEKGASDAALFGSDRIGSRLALTARLRA
jgi:hypothetical protein